MQRFIDKVKNVNQLTDLTPAILYEFVNKIIVHKPERTNGKRH
ncbi:MAG TPA: DUF4368 domain-containing protein [Candidatus Avidehalobacter gallistercoris]|uniref:DUF4368 domain-containing protein n=1 Tax=Candidatus Avidehalobacter gallistercoris TaxID=2840694 RepID=A0A9D1HJF3_9FIRM|nr:DUF4368 domain-containing protein [Candidatus Avidehalobacter gallistercoris]